MKRILITTTIIMAFASCTKNQDAMMTERESVLAHANDFILVESSTKTSITQEGKSAPTFAWKEGDVIGVIPMDGKTVQSNYEISTIGTDPKTATFDGGVWALKEGKEYAAYYPYMGTVARCSDKIEFSFLDQAQNANNSMAHIGDYDFMYATAVHASSTPPSFRFKHIVSLVRLQITVPQTDIYTNITLESTSYWFASKAELTLCDGTMSAKENRMSFSMALNNINVTSGNVLTVWFSMLPTSTLNGETMTVKIYGQNSYNTVDISGLNTFEAGKAYSFTCSAVTQEPTDYVDLGLSVKWAKCNLGASYPEGYGNYYAWGETEKKKCYSEETYKFYKTEKVMEGEFEKEYKGFTKYIGEESKSIGFKSYYDNLNTLEPNDDVAHVLLGGKWRMPTSTEFKELINNCTFESVTYHGVKGGKFTSKKTGYTNKWIFLPAAGYVHYWSGTDLGNVGFYWSCSNNLKYSSGAIFLDFDNYAYLYEASLRYCGGTIRPVLE